MESVVFERYGPPADVLELRELEQPTPNDDEVLVRVRASSVNPAEWYAVTGPLIVRGTNGLRGPKEPRVGIDYAGVVEAVGKDVTEFEPGDEVFGGRTGAYGEYVCARAAGGIARKPKNVSFEEAGVVGIAGVTALQGLRDKGRVKSGDKVLITGASGGVGTFAVQIAKALGAEVTAVCRTSNVELVRSLGADRVIDYTRTDFTSEGERYDVLLDIASTHSWRASRRVLEPDGTLVLVGAPAHSRVLGPLGQIARMFVGGKVRGSQNVVFYVAKINKEDMNVLRELIESGKVKPVVDRRYPLAEVADALEYVGRGHTRGKVAITI
jgi:NADPH:quinone reductase-like Zn-dependent oxidoreductase